MELLDDPSFNRWIKGNPNPAERQKWENWLREDPLHKEVKHKAHILYNLPYEQNRGGDMQPELRQLQARLDRHAEVYRQPTTNRKKSSGYRWAVAAAVALLVAVVGVITLYNQQQPQPTQTEEPLFSTIEVDYGEKGALKISDGSTIRLNAHSSLRYRPGQLDKSQVEVWLEGEAYFSIVRDPSGRKRNFIVHTSDGDIRVLGTRFNVNTRFDQTGVVLEEGSVEVLLKDSAKGVAGPFMLKPGQRARFSAHQPNMQVQKVDTSVYTSWLEDKLVFKDVPFKEVIANIEQTYGVSFEVNDSTLLEQKITGSVRNPDLQTLLQGLEEVFSLNIRKQGNDTFLVETNKWKVNGASSEQ